MDRETTFYDSEEEKVCHDRMFDPVSRRTVNINPSFRNPKSPRVEFNAFKFLMCKKTNRQYEQLQLLLDTDVQNHLAAISSSPNQKRLYLLGDGVLRRLAEHSEVLNKFYNYKMLDVSYEKE